MATWTNWQSARTNIFENIFRSQARLGEPGTDGWSLVRIKRFAQLAFAPSAIAFRLDATRALTSLSRSLPAFELIITVSTFLNKPGLFIFSRSSFNRGWILA